MAVVFQDHHIISKSVAGNNDLTLLLADKGEFNVDADSNRIYLPSSPAPVAQTVAAMDYRFDPTDFAALRAGATVSARRVYANSI